MMALRALQRALSGLRLSLERPKINSLAIGKTIAEVVFKYCGHKCISQSKES
jgi:hypothetical protein